MIKAIFVFFMIILAAMGVFDDGHYAPVLSVDRTDYGTVVKFENCSVVTTPSRKHLCDVTTDLTQFNQMLINVLPGGILRVGDKLHHQVVTYEDGVVVRFFCRNEKCIEDGRNDE